jgi:hypothetical protein
MGAPSYRVALMMDLETGYKRHISAGTASARQVMRPARARTRKPGAHPDFNRRTRPEFQRFSRSANAVRPDN